MDSNNDDLVRSIAEKLRKEDLALKRQLGLLRKFHLSHWIVASLGLIVFSQAMSFGQWNQHSSLEKNFNFHALLLAGCGFGLMFIAAAALALHRRLARLEKLLESRGQQSGI